MQEMCPELQFASFFNQHLWWTIITVEQTLKNNWTKSTISDWSILEHKSEHIISCIGAKIAFQSNVLRTLLHFSHNWIAVMAERLVMVK